MAAAVRGWGRLLKLGRKLYSKAQSLQCGKDRANHCFAIVGNGCIAVFVTRKAALDWSRTFVLVGCDGGRGKPGHWANSISNDGKTL